MTRTVHARSDDFEAARYAPAVKWRFEYVGPDKPPTSVMVYGVPFQLARNSHRTTLPVAQVAMLAAWAGCRLVAQPGWWPAGRYFSLYYARHARNAHATPTAPRTPP